MQHKLPLPLQVTLMTGLLTLALLGPPSIAVADSSATTSLHQVEPQEPHTDPIITPGAPSDLIFGTYLRGEPSSPDGVSYSIRGIGLDDADNIYVAGITDDPNFPVTPGLEHEVLGAHNIFVAKFSPDGSNLTYSTLVGPVPEEVAYHDNWFGGRLSFAVGGDGAVYLTGATTSPSYPVTPGAYQVTCEAPCVFVTKLAPNGGIAYSTYLGTPEANGTGIAVDTAGDIYVGGYTYGGFPTTV
ncbi:MAG: SBBP repeat-containing protein, partial [Caldilinea sp.]